MSTGARANASRSSRWALRTTSPTRPRPHRPERRPEGSAVRSFGSYVYAQTERRGNSMTLPKMWRWLLPCVIVVSIFSRAIPCWAQDRGGDDPWRPWGMVLGTWEGGDGSPAQGKGTFTFAPELQGAVLVRKSHGDYPATTGRPAFSHDDLTIVHRESDGGYRAIYFDNEHHVIRYSVALSGDSSRITFLSDTTAQGPAFRLTYRAAGIDSLYVTFAIAPPGSPRTFAPYLEAGARRKP